MAVTIAELLPVLLLLAFLLLLGFAVVYVSFISKRRGASVGESADAVAPHARPAERRRGGIARMRRAAAAEAAPPDAAADEWGVIDDDIEPVGAAGHRGARRREARREARLAREAALAEFRERQEAEDARRAEVREREEEDEARAEEEGRKLREEKEKLEREEYEQWRGDMSVEDSGAGDDEVMTEDPEMLTSFCNYVRDVKIVLLEELGAEFGLRTEDAIDRLKRLEETGRLSGFFDDRGKFIYVTEEEMRAVAAFIAKKGRVSIQELAVVSTRLLGLDKINTA